MNSTVVMTLVDISHQQAHIGQTLLSPILSSFLSAELEREIYGFYPLHFWLYTVHSRVILRDICDSHKHRTNSSNQGSILLYLKRNCNFLLKKPTLLIKKCKYIQVNFFILRRVFFRICTPFRTFSDIIFLHPKDYNLIFAVKIVKINTAVYYGQPAQNG